MPVTSTHPVALLRDQVTALEAAIAACLAKTTRKRVHELRSECRRVESLIFLLEPTSEMPVHAAQAEQVLRRLRHIRRAAGKVRDLDVQRKLLKAEVLERRRIGNGDSAIREGTKKLRKLDKGKRKQAAFALGHVCASGSGAWPPRWKR